MREDRMVKDVNTDEMSAEEEYELRAAFGDDAVDNGDLIQLEKEDLDPVETPDYRLKYVLEVGDWVTVQHQAGNVTTGPVEEVDTVGFTLDPRNRVTSGYYGYGDFGIEEGDRAFNQLIDINGEPADRVIDRREEAGE